VLDEVGELRAKPAGTVRLLAPPMAVAMNVWSRLTKFARDYPDVVLDITTEGDSRPDLVGSRFDAGIHLGEFVQRDMSRSRSPASSVRPSWPRRRTSSRIPSPRRRGT
jgi:DNA-binding transcriptional LysR family regulator